MTVSARLEWGDENRREVQSIEELDRALQELEASAADEPFIVELFRDGDGSLSLGLGRSVTVLDHVPEDLNPPYRQACAPGITHEPIWFRFRGDVSEFPPDASVPPEAGRRALRHFFATGELTSELSWRET